MPASSFRHGKNGKIEIDGDENASFTEIDSTGWEATFQMERHTPTGFKANGNQRLVYGIWSGSGRITCVGRTDEQIQSADINLVEGNIVPVKLYELNSGTPLTGNAGIDSVQRRVMVNAEVQYTIQFSTDGAWVIPTDPTATPA